ncbi:VENN motif pre-toxin domain-containing protein [Leclercia adecarboxylata]|uniref:VENN motif pre-toxin domain-containing protein n=1 Tax=Leclercia adecarboxylata TaxID=83655 RepID=UPI002DBDE1B3|nr:VENN motif pre-toxin domain-containing protein [Leclercia adecarboxylata]
MQCWKYSKQKAVVTYGKDREKLGSSQQPASKRVIDENDSLAGYPQSRGLFSGASERGLKFGRAIQAATAAVKGAAGGDIAGALAGAAAPYVAEVIGHRSGLEDGIEKAAAHAVANAALAAMQGQSALAGAAGAVAGELAGSIAKEMYGKEVAELSESQKQTISSLATIAAGIAGGLAGDGTAAAVAGAQSGKTVVENNSLNLGNGMASTIAMNAAWNQYAVDNNLTPEETQAGLDKLAKGDLPEGANITKAIVEGYQDGVFMAGAIYLGPTVTVGKGITGAIIGGGANSAFQYISMSPESEFSYYSAAVAAGAGYLAPGYNIKGNTLINMGGAFMTDGTSLSGQGGAIAGSLAGGYFGKYAPDLLVPYVGSFSGVIGDIGSASVFEISNDTIKELIKNKDKKQ